MGAAAIAVSCPFTIYKRKYFNSIISEKNPTVAMTSLLKITYLTSTSFIYKSYIEASFEVNEWVTS